MSGAADAVLAIDAGNTRIKWGLYEGGHWRARGVLPTADAPEVVLRVAVRDAALEDVRDAAGASTGAGERPVDG